MVKEPSKYRPIMDARYSNLSLLAEWFACPNILDFCATLSHKQYWFKADQKAGWQHIHIHPLHSRFFCFVWKERIFAYTTPAFGDTTAPYIFTYMGATFKRALKSRNIHFVLYIDDLLVAAKDSYEDSCLLRASIIKLAVSLGVTFATPKCPLPAFKGEALGFEVDTEQGVLGISKRRKAKVNALLQSLLDDAVSVKATPIKQVARLVGLVISCQALHPQTMWFVAPLIHLFGHSWDFVVQLVPSQLLRVFGWIQLVEENPRRLWISPPARRYLSTDATLTQLGASLWNSSPSFFPHTGVSTPKATALARPPVKAINIAHFEALAIPWALECFVDVLPPSSHITWAVDNQNVWYGFKCGFARMDYIAKQIDIFMSIVCKHKLWVEFVWVPSAINMEADQLSRLFVPNQEWELHQFHWTCFLTHIQEASWPCPTIDAFASSANNKFPKYFAHHRDGKAMGSFFYSTLEVEEIYWVFAPFFLLSRVLSKLQQEHVCAWVVLPRWTARAWWQYTSKASIQYVFNRIHTNSPLFMQPSPDNTKTPINPEYEVDVWFFNFRLHC